MLKINYLPTYSYRMVGLYTRWCQMWICECFAIADDLMFLSVRQSEVGIMTFSSSSPVTGLQGGGKVSL